MSSLTAACPLKHWSNPFDVFSMRDSGSVKLYWSLSFGCSVGVLGTLPLGFFPVFWGSTENKRTDEGIYGDTFALFYDSDRLAIGWSLEVDGQSVRCIKD
jgi:hypothetical protein